MKRIIILAMVLVMLLTSIGGCWGPWDEGGRGGRGEGHDRGEGPNFRYTREKKINQRQDKGDSRFYRFCKITK